MKVNRDRNIKKITIGTIFFTLAASQFALAQDALWERYSNQGKAAGDGKHYAEAEKFYQDALLRATKFSPNKQLAAESAGEIANLKYQRGEYVDAVPYYREAVDYLQKYLASATIHDEAQRCKLRQKLAEYMLYLADCYRAEANYVKTEATYRKALALDLGTATDAELQYAHLQAELGDVLNIEGRYNEAESLYKKALPVLEKANREDLLLEVLQDYDSLLRFNGRSQEAESLELRIRQLRKAKAS